MRWVNYCQERPTAEHANVDSKVLFCRRYDSGTVQVLGYLDFDRHFVNPSVYWLDESSQSTRLLDDEYWQPACNTIVVRDDVTIDYSKPLGIKKYPNRVRILTFCAEGEGPIIGQILGGGRYFVISWTIDGRALNLSADYNLINIPRQYSRTRWINFYTDGSSQSFNNREDADSAVEHRTVARVACVKNTVTAKEGEGLDVPPPTGDDVRAIDLSDLAQVVSSSGNTGASS